MQDVMCSGRRTAAGAVTAVLLRAVLLRAVLLRGVLLRAALLRAALLRAVLLRAVLVYAVLLPVAVFDTAGLHAQVPPSVSDTTRRARPFLAAGQALLVNVVVNRFDVWVLDEDWARVGPSDWWRNLRLGWEWDEDEFGTNMFSHPYHGGLYFNAARANGLSFWEAAPLVFFGSWTWEYFGETYRPSLNDFFMTSFGGIALGEVFHRAGAAIRDNTASGSTRMWREVAALPFDPMAGFNRLVRGEWRRIGPNPSEHTPGSHVVRLSAGTRVTADSAALPVVIADLQYGDPFRTAYEAPFDVFAVRGELSRQGDRLNLLRASGRLFALNLNSRSARHRHVFTVNQRYDFISNPAHSFGAQSVEAGFYSRWGLSDQAGLRTQFFVDGVVLGALDAPDSGVGRRTYDFGPGLGTRFEVAFERSGITWVTVHGRTEYIHSVSGASADHNVAFGGVEVTLPVAMNLGIGVRSGYYRRDSRYTDRPDESREFPEYGLFLTWTAASAPPQPRR